MPVAVVGVCSCAVVRPAPWAEVVTPLVSRSQWLAVAVPVAPPARPCLSDAAQLPVTAPVA